MKTLYLLVNFFTIFIPFIYSYHGKIRFNEHFGSFFKANLIVALIFIVWDATFTRMGVWWFNENYLLGPSFLSLPLEEILFFICIPFSCVFTFFCLDKFYDLKWNRTAESVFCVVFSAGLLLTGSFNYDKIYTFITFLSTGMVCLYLKFVARVDWFGKVTLVYGILLIPFFVVNGILTGTGIEDAVVKYNHAENLNLRILTIPIEDAFYGFELILLNIYLFKLFESRRLSNITSNQP